MIQSNKIDDDCDCMSNVGLQQIRSGEDDVLREKNEAFRAFFLSPYNQERDGVKRGKGGSYERGKGGSYEREREGVKRKGRERVTRERREGVTRERESRFWV